MIYIVELGKSARGVASVYIAFEDGVDVTDRVGKDLGLAVYRNGISGTRPPEEMFPKEEYIIWKRKHMK